MKWKKDLSKRPAKAGVEEASEIEILKSRSIAEAPEKGSQRASNGQLTFESLPISSKTLEALKNANLTVATDIQAAGIPHALAGRDILGAAKTGSGKTLAFVIPVLERLFIERWSTEDGLAAVIMTPTRELALQIFDVLRLAGKKHQLSAGLITGGKKEFFEEQERVVKMNVLVATPGRLLQHLEQTAGFDASQLQILVLDEADRVLDMGFRHQLDRILEYLPPRQTLLFSATQTKSVKDLARLSLNNPEYLYVHDKEEHVTPTQLKQNFILCPLHEKLNTLFSFLKSHLKNKIIVFFSTCSQVRFVYECLCGMQPGIPLIALHGKIKQDKRTLVYMDFLKKKSACMFATDIAARGLDFPDVDWVVQMDAPEDMPMYIHRVGRTARYNAGGRALLILMPQEEKAVRKELQDAHVPITKLSMNPKHTISVTSAAANLLISNPEYKNLAKKAFSGYIKSLMLLSHREIKVASLPLQNFSISLGLAQQPELPTQPTASETGEKKEKNVNRALDKLKKQIKEAKEEKKRLKNEASTGISSANDNKKRKNEESDSSDEDDGLLVPKVRQAGEELIFPAKDVDTDIVAKKKKLKINVDGISREVIKVQGAKKITFEGSDEEGSDSCDEDDDVDADEKQKRRVAAHQQKIMNRLSSTREEDKRIETLRIREKHKAEKARDKRQRDEEIGHGVVLANASEEDDEGRSSDGSEGSDSEGEESDASSENSHEDEEDEEEAIKAREKMVLAMMAAKAEKKK